jgi:hypothetical protein
MEEVNEDQRDRDIRARAKKLELSIVQKWDRTAKKKG